MPTMKETDKMDNLAGRTEQLLPPAPMSKPSAEPGLDLQRELVPSAASKAPASALQSAGAGWVLTSPAQSLTPEPEVTAAWAPALSTQDRLWELVQEHAVQLKHLGADSLAVVIKPDAQTQLFLHLDFRHGQVEARAELGRGDYAALTAHWPELQQKLSEQGVRLAPLAREPGLDGQANHGFAQSHSRQEPPRQDRSPFDPAAPVVLPGTPAKKKTPLVATSRGIPSGRWQTWA
jgi:hypothetical protein